MTQEDVWDRTTQTIGRALETDVPTLVEAVPSAGKSTGLIEAISDTGVQSTVFTARHDLYDDYKERCEEYGLEDHEELPSLHEYCPTINGENGSEWGQRVQNAYNNGWTGSTIHTYDTHLFGETIPCERGHECQYKQEWDFDSGNYDVMIGNYKHAYNQNVIDDRTTVVDESQSGAFIESFDSNTVTSVVSRYLQSHDGLPFKDRTDLIKNRDDNERYAEAIEWFGEQGVEATSVLNTDGRSSDGRIDANTHALGSLMTYALLDGRDLGNGWEHASLDLHTNSNAVAARNRGATNESDELFVLRPPDLSSANGVVCLDGTPSPKMWEMVIDADLNHEQVLSDEERGKYLTDVLGYQIVQTTDATNVYSNADNVNAKKDGALFDAIHRETGVRPSLITSMKAAEEYAEAGVLSSIDDVDDLDGCKESDKIEWYGNFKGTNDFEDERVGIVSGSQHYGDDHIKMWCAFANESVERASERGGPDLEYSTELGNEVLKNMREHEVFQAIMRFERGNGDGATVFVNTSAIPDWVPTEHENSIKKVSDGMKQVIAAIDDLEEHEFRTNQVTDHPLVSISETQVQRNLNELNELGTVSSERKPGRATHWSPTNEFARSLFDVGEGTESIGPSSITGSSGKCSLS